MIRINLQLFAHKREWVAQRMAVTANQEIRC